MFTIDGTKKVSEIIQRAKKRNDLAPEEQYKLAEKELEKLQKDKRYREADDSAGPGAERRQPGQGRKATRHLLANPPPQTGEIPQTERGHWLLIGVVAGSAATLLPGHDGDSGHSDFGW